MGIKAYFGPSFARQPVVQEVQKEFYDAFAGSHLGCEKEDEDEDEGMLLAINESKKWESLWML